MQVEVCKSHISKLRGLYFSNKSRAVLLKNCNSVHTLFFTHKLDIAFLDSKYRVISAHNNVASFRFLKCKKAVHTVEKFHNDLDEFKVKQKIKIN